MQGNVARLGDDGGNKIRDVTPITKPVRERSARHLAYIRSQLSVVSGRGPCIAHHLTHVQPKARGLKGGDQWTVPMTNDEHLALHARGDEAAWWREQGIDPIKLAVRLWAESGGMAS